MRTNYKLKTLTAFHFNGAALTIHWEILQIHWATRGDCKSFFEEKKSKRIEDKRLDLIQQTSLFNFDKIHLIERKTSPFDLIRMKVFGVVAI